MADTFVKIATVTVGSGGAANMSFSSIPNTYTDLCLKFSVRANSGSFIGVNLTLNGSSTSFTGKQLEGSGAAASSSNVTQNVGTGNGSTTTASTFSSHEIYFPNYAGSTNKSYSVDSVSETNATTAYADLQAGLWSNTAAITSLAVAPSTGNFVQYSTATLYGILKA